MTAGGSGVSSQEGLLHREEGSLSACENCSPWMAGLYGQAAQTAEGWNGSQISARQEGEESGPDSQIPWNEPFCSVLFSCTLLCLGPEREKRRPVPLSPGGLTSPQREDVKDVVGGMSPHQRLSAAGRRRHRTQ